MGGSITIPYAPREWAKKLHNSDKRWKVLVLHRRAGKTIACINHLIRDAIKTKESRFAYIAPTYKQAKNIAWDYLKHYSFPIPQIKINESELRIDYPNGSRITLYGADNPDSLRGLALWGVIFDEYSQQPSNIFSEIIRPALADHFGYAIWIGTPKGKNEFYRLYEQAKTDDKWLAMLLTVDDTHLIPETELEDAKKVMTNDEFLQEWFCSFEASIKGAIYAYELDELRKNNRIQPNLYEKALKVHTVWDLGKGANMAIGFYQKVFNQLRKIDYWEGSGDQTIPDAIKVIQNKPYVYGKHFAPHDIDVIDLSTGVSRKESAKKLGINFEVVPKLAVEDGIHAGKLIFPRLWVDSKCTLWLDAISQYKRDWDDNRGMFKDNPLHDWTSHAADEYRYASIVESDMTNEDQRDKQQHQFQINEQQYNPNEF